MTDVAYLCHNCGSVHEVESIRQNLYLNQRSIASYAVPSRQGTHDFAEFLLRWRISKGIARALWPRYPRRSRPYC